jgi:hypothetical protein
MSTIFKKLASHVMAGSLALSSLGLPLTANADAFDYLDTDGEPTGGEMLADAFLVRPFMLVSTVVTTATFIVTLPFSLLGGNAGEAGEKLVVDPAAYTFVRPLGEL